MQVASWSSCSKISARIPAHVSAFATRVFSRLVGRKGERAGQISATTVPGHPHHLGVLPMAQKNGAPFSSLGPKIAGAIWKARLIYARDVAWVTFCLMLPRLEINLGVPDLWQQEAVRALRDGKDVIVQAPTGSGKTYIFELLYPSLKGQAVFTVPTRALANDKLAEWRARGWDVGIATGDLALNLGAKILVATLETQRARFLRRQAPN